MMKEDRDFIGIRPEDDQDIKVIYPNQSSGESLWSEARSLARDFLIAIVAAVLIIVFVVQPVRVDGTSMQPKLESDERIFVNKFIYSFDSVKRDDIVVFWYPDDPSKSFIKRVIGLPGETIRIDYRGVVYINGKAQPEPFLAADKTLTPRSIPDTYVKPHYYFVMGDNRDASNDSRSWGLVPEKYIFGKAIFRYWPLQRIGVLK